MLLTGEKVSTAQAAEWGLVSKMVEDDQLAGEVDALARKFVNGPTLAYGLIRRLIQKASRNSHREQIALEMEYQTVARSSEDFAEARKAFAEKRKPVFKGR
jgi:2-(1,2-epoxy-1,2-dihydrophenyl)acetyl-CoA isomerase